QRPIPAGFSCHPQSLPHRTNPASTNKPAKFLQSRCANMAHTQWIAKSQYIVFPLPGPPPALRQLMPVLGLLSSARFPPDTASFGKGVPRSSGAAIVVTVDDYRQVICVF